MGRRLPIQQSAGLVTGQAGRPFAVCQGPSPVTPSSPAECNRCPPARVGPGAVGVGGEGPSTSVPKCWRRIVWQPTDRRASKQNGSPPPPTRRIRPFGRLAIASFPWTWPDPSSRAGSVSAPCSAPCLCGGIRAVLRAPLSGLGGNRRTLVMYASARSSAMRTADAMRAACSTSSRRAEDPDRQAQCPFCSWVCACVLLAGGSGQARIVSRYFSSCRDGVVLFGSINTTVQNLT
ncbi:hypothetical protein B0T26DRAFT_298362 [Lasiosphaeria miniovina]|uniref:Uncharacterized protein n=1 Tax=Lasiosphaeria miniovina TaxID=1954250 RepID=A0AA40AKL9_9PEZI|nr:uncharacterized protein B0T26DRAFT_298362 [Lasiosphaeria miniovina]KAK0717510.1 hypothetical protein B0T26DRAFT_298362 [Lasiosphaeria miniovina]